MQQSRLALALVVLITILILLSSPHTLVEGMNSGQCTMDMDTTQRSMTNAASIDVMKGQISAAEAAKQQLDKLENTVGSLTKRLNDQDEAMIALKGSIAMIGDTDGQQADLEEAGLG